LPLFSLEGRPEMSTFSHDSNVRYDIGGWISGLASDQKNGQEQPQA